MMMGAVIRVRHLQAREHQRRMANTQKLEEARKNSPAGFRGSMALLTP